MIAIKELVARKSIKKQREVISTKIPKRLINTKKKILTMKRLRIKKFNHKSLNKEKCGRVAMNTSIMMMKDTVIIIMIIIMIMDTTMTMAMIIITTTIIMSPNII